MSARVLRRRPATVEAMQVWPTNLDEIADWSGGIVVRQRGILLIDEHGNPILAEFTEWIVRDSFSRVRVMDDHRVFAEHEAIVPVVGE